MGINTDLPETGLWRSVPPMSKSEILAELPNLSVADRDEVRRRLAELDEETADDVALVRSEELAGGTVQPKSQAEVFGNARSALS